MPVIEANEPLRKKPPIILLFGDPGVSKTSIVATCANPVNLDFDRGIQRSHGRKSVVDPDDWEEILRLENEGFFKKFLTVGIDTAKAALDDFLMPYVVRQDYKLAKNKLQAYGAIGDAFKLFVNNLRFNDASILIIAHSIKDEDAKKMKPDITGSSYQLLLRIADQVGYVTVENNQRVINWNPSESWVGKNTAQMEKTLIPHMDDPKFRTFGAELFNVVRDRLHSMSDEQLEALKLSEKYQDQVEQVKTLDDINNMIDPVNALPKHLNVPLKHVMIEKAKSLGWVMNKELKRFEVTTGTNTPPANNPPAKEEAAAAPVVVPPVTVVTKQSLQMQLGDCPDLPAISHLYFEHSEFIEANPDLKAMFDNASDMLRKLEEQTADQGTKPVQGSLIAEPAATVKYLAKDFKKKYTDEQELSKVLNGCTAIANLANLFYVNAEMFDKSPDLKAQFDAKKLDLDSTPPLEADKGRKGTQSAKEVANA